MKKVTSIIGIVAGVAVLILGVMAFKGEFYKSVAQTIYPESYVSSASFGADFYTYIYDAVKSANDSIGNLSSTVGASVTNAANAQLKMMGKIGGIIVIALGTLIITSNLSGLATALEEGKKKANNEYVPLEEKVASEIPQYAETVDQEVVEVNDEPEAVEEPTEEIEEA